MKESFLVLGRNPLILVLLYSDIINVVWQEQRGALTWLPSRFTQAARGLSQRAIALTLVRAIVAEFNGYNSVPLSSFPLNPIKERWIMWKMKTTALPWIYWHRMLKGEQFEGDYIKFLQWKK